MNEDPRGFDPNDLGDCHARIDQLKAELWKYGKHLTACRLQKTHDTWCDCGWTEVRATLAPTPASGGTADEL